MSSSDWRLQPLKSFWQNVNWDNRRLVVTPASNGSVANATTLSFLMPVREYFRAISWTGIPAIAVTSTEAKLSNAQAEADESKETLEDFLDDISKFF